MAKASDSEHSTSSHLLVVAIDFGTTYSGYAFSLRNDPLKVQTNQNWIAGSEKLISLKTPTCVLLTPDQQFHSFGFEAENKYLDLAFDEEHSDWLFFRRFKMLLYKHKKLTRDAQIADIKGTTMPAMTIFAMSIRYLRDHLIDQLNCQYTGLEETDIQYVLTVPAIWDDSAKQFMREAAIKEWITIPQAFTRNNVLSMMKRCLQVIGARDGHIRAKLYYVNMTVGLLSEVCDTDVIVTFEIVQFRIGAIT